jgi:lipoate-protein ligase B
VTLDVLWLGRIAYRSADELQRRIAREVAAGARGPTLLLLEHDPVITLGRRARSGHILVAPDVLARLGVDVVECDRGGDVTFHGPGQLVGYPILDLRRWRCDVHAYVHALEETMIRVSADYGIRAGRIPGCTGAWVGREKIGAIGVRLDHWVTRHGFAYNVGVDLDYFRLIVPCGIPDKGVTSLERLTGTAPPLPDVAQRTARHFAAIFGWRAKQRACV